MTTELVPITIAINVPKHLDINKVHYRLLKALAPELTKMTGLDYGAMLVNLKNQEEVDAANTLMNYLRGGK